MKINTWPLSRQVISLFLVLGLSMAVIVMAITTCLLVFLIKPNIIQQTQEEIDSFYERRMQLILNEDVKLITNFLNKHVSTTLLTAELAESMYEATKIGVYDYNVTWSSHDDTFFSLEKGAYFTKDENCAHVDLESTEEICQNTTEAIDKLKPFDRIYKALFNVNVHLSLYIGFDFDDLIYFYPCSYFVSDDYSPVKREWYHKAKSDNSSTIITDPYKDVVTDLLTISFSKSISFGVVGIDILFDHIQNIYTESTFWDTGFTLLVSNDGVVLGQPPWWDNHFGDEIVILHDTESTGVTEAVWDVITNPTFDNTVLSFHDFNGDLHRFVKRGVVPKGSNEPTHFVMVCVKESEFDAEVDATDQKFHENLILILISNSTIILAIILIVISGIVLFSWLISNQLAKLLEFLKSLNSAGHKPMGFKEANTEDLASLKEYMPELHNACLKKLQKLDTVEWRYHFFKWGGPRPKDYTLYDQWRKKLYPTNELMNLAIPNDPTFTN